MIWLLLIPAIILTGFLIVDFQISAPAYKGPKTDHFDGHHFFNPDDHNSKSSRSIFDMIKWAFTGNRGEWIRLYDKDVQHAIPKESPKNPSELHITFINHSSFLIRLQGLNILTDPIWSNRASPYSWVGVKRMRPPGIHFEDLPPINIVLISHNHYDHLDLPTVLNLKINHDPLFVTPLGVGKFLNKKGITRTVELDWWQQQEVHSTLKLTGLPARHFSGRGVFDRDQTLWCGYMLETPHQTIYFAGDTAYGSFFNEIGKRFDINLSIIPIGAYKPHWFMKLIHTNPAEAVQIHQDVESSHSIASHFGTFPLADEGMTEPQKDLSEALKKAGLSSTEFRTLNEGETRKYRPARSITK